MVLNRLISVILIGLTAVTGDNLLLLNNNKLYKALCDNLTHGAIGGLTWATVSFFSNTVQWDKGSILSCAILAMVIDLDHFLAARSFQINDATRLAHRPFLHCSTIPVGLFVFGCILSMIKRSSNILRITCLVSGAFFSHHFRDAARRGLWFWPFTSTRPFHPIIYVLSVGILPHVLVSVLSKYPVQSVTYRVYSV